MWPAGYSLRLQFYRRSLLSVSHATFQSHFFCSFPRIHLSTRFALAMLFFSSLSPLIPGFLMTSNEIFVPQFHTLLTQQSTSDHLLLYQFSLILKIFSILAKMLTRPSITVVDLLTASHLIAVLQFTSIYFPDSGTGFFS